MNAGGSRTTRSNLARSESSPRRRSKTDASSARNRPPIWFRSAFRRAAETAGADESTARTSAAPALRAASPQAPRVAESVQDPPPFRVLRQAQPVFSLIEKPSCLLPPRRSTSTARPSTSVSTIPSSESSRPRATRTSAASPFQPAGGGVVAQDNRAGRINLIEEIENHREADLDPGRKRLNDEERPVPVDDEAGKAVGLPNTSRPAVREPQILSRYDRAAAMRPLKNAASISRPAGARTRIVIRDCGLTYPRPRGAPRSSTISTRLPGGRSLTGSAISFEKIHR